MNCIFKAYFAFFGLDDSVTLKSNSSGFMMNIEKVTGKKHKVNNTDLYQDLLAFMPMEHYQSISKKNLSHVRAKSRPEINS
jgi:hypothetical protein